MDKQKSEENAGRNSFEFAHNSVNSIYPDTYSNPNKLDEKDVFSSIPDDFDDQDDSYAMPNGSHAVLDEDLYSMHNNLYIDHDNTYALPNDLYSAQTDACSDNMHDSSDNVTDFDNEANINTYNLNDEVIDDHLPDEKSQDSDKDSEENQSPRLLPKFVALFVLCAISCAVLLIYQDIVSGNNADEGIDDYNNPDFSYEDSDVLSNTDSTTVTDKVSADTTTTASQITYKTLKEGDSSDEVKNMQERLCKLGYISKESCTGYYGTYTKKIIKMFQKKAGLKQTGVADNETLQKLYSDDAPTCY